MADEEKGEKVVAFPGSPAKPTSSTEKIWGKTVLRHGYTAVPSILIRAQARLEISATQMNIILQLLDYWIEPTRKPFPTKRDLAKRMGVTEKTVQINVGQLEKKGLIEREARRTAAGDWNSNLYHLDPLIEAVKKLEPDFQAEKEAKALAARKAERPVLRKRLGSKKLPRAHA